MERVLKAAFGAIMGALMSIVSLGIPIAIAMLVTAFFCNIHAEESYSWLSGIWHGIFVIPNYCRHFMDPDILYKACNITTMYNLFWWICLIIQIPTIICIVCYMVFSPILAAFSAATDE